MAITVEGANILTRSLIIFGQGAIRCHPYVLREIAATRETDRAKASVAFDAALFGHIRFALTNFARTLVMGFTGSHFVGVPADVAPETRRYYQQLTRFSAALAFLADVSMGVLGGNLKRKEKLSARLGDILSLMYLCSATLKRFEAEGRQAADAPLMHWAIWDAMFKAQTAIEGVISNFPRRVLPELLLAHRVPARPSVRSAVRRPGPPGGEAPDRAVGDARPPDRRHVRRPRGERPGRPDRAGADGDGGRRADRGEAQGGDARRPARRANAAGCGHRRAGRARVAAGVIDREEARTLIVQRELVARVIRVDDFAADLGASLLQPAIDADSRRAVRRGAGARRHERGL